jgi:hypothetical protein
MTVSSCNLPFTAPKCHLDDSTQAAVIECRPYSLATAAVWDSASTVLKIGERRVAINFSHDSILSIKWERARERVIVFFCNLDSEHQW